MEFAVATQFVIMSLHPEKGRIMVDETHFRYTLTGAVLMDLYLNGEISLTGKMVIPSFRKNGDLVHDMFADLFARSFKPRRVSFWLRRLARKKRFIFSEIINSLTNKSFVRHERRYFLNIIPYNRYFLTDSTVRTRIIEELRDVLLHNKTSTSQQRMLIGLVKASGSCRLLRREKGERRLLRRKCNEYLKNNEMANEIDKAIREIQAAIVASVTAATAAAGASH